MLAQRVLQIRFEDPKPSKFNWPVSDLREQQELNRIAQTHEAYTPGVRRSINIDLHA
jgi:hypothetical protein